MWQDCSTARGQAAPAGGFALDTVWHVRADVSYNVVRTREAPACLIAIRTLSGKGRIHLDPEGAVDVGRDSLLIVENRKIRRYHFVGPEWHFWWFEFSSGGAPFFPLHQCLHIPRDRREGQALDEVFRALRWDSFAQRSLASAGLAHLLHRWMADWHGQRRVSPHQGGVDRAIVGMHERTDGSWSVAEMARMAGLSERRFRQVFRGATGQSPKRFYDGVRLDLARQILAVGSAKLAEVSERVGFSSPFHLSRAFRARFGVPPSAFRRHAAAPNVPGANLVERTLEGRHR